MVRRSTPFLTGKCFFRLATSSTGAALWPTVVAVSGRVSVAASLAIKPLGVPAGGPVAGAFLLVGRVERAAFVVGEWAARRKRTARRQVGQGRHHAGDLLEPAVSLCRRFRLAGDDREMRDRGEEAVRVGMLRRAEQIVDVGLFDLL